MLRDKYLIEEIKFLRELVNELRKDIRYFRADNKALIKQLEQLQDENIKLKAELNNNEEVIEF